MADAGRSHERGVSLAETIVALAIVGFIAVVSLAALWTFIKSNEVSRTRIAAESLARSEIEYVYSENYTVSPWSYSLPGTPPPWDASHNSLPSGYEGYSVSVAGADISGYSTSTHNIQSITAIVNHNSAEVMRIVTYRTE